MNRAERRRAEKETKQQVEEYNKNLKWFNNWTPSQQRFHRDMIHKIEDKAFKDLEKIMDSCYIAAMIQATELNLEQCKDICRLADKHMIETQNMINKEGKKYYMKINDESLRNEIKEEVKGIIKDNRKINNLEIIRILDKEYDLGKKDYQIICKEVREELSKEVLKDIENDIDENEKEVSTLGKDIPTRAKGYISAALSMEGEHGFEIPAKKQLADELLEGLKNSDLTLDKAGTTKNGLEVEAIIVKGKYARYRKSTTGVAVGEKVYKDVKDIEEAKEALKIEIGANMDLISKQLKELVEKKKQYEEKEKEELEKYEELEQVFAM